MRIVFMGTPDFAVASLEVLHSSEIEVAAVITAADKPAGRGRKMMMSSVKSYALQHNIPVLQPANLKDPGFIEELAAIEAD
ncbi:MAG TPA: methionyl-tRNA formyltransferase, partial [Cryomorphaceae bacterium]|nr:methionyl-tRNA formyltransferase [Cryomorphaceae bacterium]